MPAPAKTPQTAAKAAKKDEAAVKKHKQEQSKKHRVLTTPAPTPQTAATASKRKAGKQKEEAVVKKPKVKEPSDAEEVLEQYLESRDRWRYPWKRDKDKMDPNLVPRPDVRNYSIDIPHCYGQECLNHCASGDDWLSGVFLEFLGEIGWIATHLMYHTYTNYSSTYPIIEEDNIRQSLNTFMHPKHWRSEDFLHRTVPGVPIPFEPKTKKERAMYVGKNFKRSGADEETLAARKEEAEERKRIDASNEEDPDCLIRAAADRGVYICQLSTGIGYGGFTGKMAAEPSFNESDEENDEERRSLGSFLSAVCACGSRALFEKLTPSDKAQIDSFLGPGYSDLPKLLDIPLTCTGAEEFDKVFPLPPPEYRLDACNMIPYINRELLFKFGREWFSHSLTPRAAAILTAALSAVLYKTHQHQLENKANGEKEVAPWAGTYLLRRWSSGGDDEAALPSQG